MKIHTSSIILASLVFLLTACGASATPTEEAAFSNVYTAAASTLSAQDSLFTPTITPTTIVTSTPFTFPTTIPTTGSVQSHVSYSSVSIANGCNNADYVSDVTIADGTVLAPGESFTKTWEFQNTGTCAWNEDYVLTFVSGSDMDGETTEIAQDVEAGSSADISISLAAPDDAGAYTGYWRLADEEQNAFGEPVYVMIVVSEDASTATPTITATSESTATAEPTATSAPILTLEPTTTPTEVPTSTPAE